MRCGECGSKHLQQQSVKGRSFSFKDYSSVMVTQPLELKVCQNCDNIIIKAGEGEAVDRAIQASIAEQVRIAIEAIKNKHACEQKEIALRLGVSPEYLSEVKSGRSVPSFQLFNFLKTMAMDDEAFETASPDIHIEIDNKAAITIGSY